MFITYYNEDKLVIVETSSISYDSANMAAFRDKKANNGDPNIVIKASNIAYIEDTYREPS